MEILNSPDGNEWVVSYHAKQRIKLYEIKQDVITDVFTNGIVTKLSPDVVKMSTKRIEMVLDTNKNRIITFYIR